MIDPKVAERLADLPRKMLRAEREDERKPVADLRRDIGQLVERALVLAGISKQHAAYAMHYADQGTVSRWCSGLERPCFDKLLTLEGFDVAYILAMAERNARIETTTTITIKRTA